MKVSLHTVQQYIDFELPPVGELIERINEQLGGVEEVIEFGEKYKDVVSNLIRYISFCNNQFSITSTKDSSEVLDSIYTYFYFNPKELDSNISSLIKINQKSINNTDLSKTSLFSKNTLKLNLKDKVVLSHRRA